MAFASFLGTVAVSAILWGAQGSVALNSDLYARTTLTTCNTIAAAVSNASHVYFPGMLSTSCMLQPWLSLSNDTGALQYANDISHWASSSSALAACSVEPGTATDVGIIVCILCRM